MKNSVLTTLATAALLLFASCGSRNGSGSAESANAPQAASGMEVDDLLSDAENLTGKTVTVEGVCTHACKHGATKIFLMGSDDTQVIRIEAASLGSFDTKCVNSVVRVDGILREQRIDEDYLRKWEARLAASTAPEHGEGEGGCATEKNARQETATTAEGRIADFRTRIAAREAECGKAYLSFYYVEATGYEIL